MFGEKFMNKLLSFLAFFMFTGSLVAQEVEEVIVTANKKEQNVQDIPMNITVISEQTLEDRGIATPEDTSELLLELVLLEDRKTLLLGVLILQQLKEDQEPHLYLLMKLVGR